MKIAFTYNVKNTQPSIDSDLSDQHDLEFDAPETIDGIASSIEANGHEVTKVEAGDNVFERLKELKGKIDLVFNIAEGLRGDARESQIPLFCEILEIPYTHSSPTVHAISLNKTYTKLLLKGAGIKVPGSVIVEKDSSYDDSDLQYPLLIKPNCEGSSKGIFAKNLVQNRGELDKRLAELWEEEYEGEFLVEEYIDGREFTVAVLGNYPPKVLPIVEQSFDFLPKDLPKIAGYELKWVYEDNLKDVSQAYTCPAKLTPEMEDHINDVSLKVYRTLDVKDVARIDYRLNDNGELYFIEINTIPGMIPDETVISYFPLAARKSGLDHKAMVGVIIDNAVRRYGLIAKSPVSLKSQKTPVTG
jgi:D-alanine-D-alanine ligase